MTNSIKTIYHVNTHKYIISDIEILRENTLDYITMQGDHICRALVGFMYFTTWEEAYAELLRGVEGRVIRDRKALRASNEIMDSVRALRKCGSRRDST